MSKMFANSSILALLAFAAGIFCIQLDAFALNLALPQIGIDLSASEGGLKWVISVYLLSVYVSISDEYMLGVVAVVFISAPKLSSFGMYLIGITICAVFLGIANALTLVATQSVVSPVVAGTASGITKTTITLAAGLGVVLTGKAADQAIGLSADHIIQSISVNIGWFYFSIFVFICLWRGLKSIRLVV
ncbi:hypothetical protein H0A36_18305 [Endozoicomonas sp. SM1973]|uniref:Uncharacterized protein n=1 Tax=Spartinivicinus marinus TaxID=2994442 RepID=A0A853IDG0_9GAMM|nr:hypothetical protein [Spartinivicinus marinus]MCX4027269.1 hypothetical protein [Spartinivicinus marinus]NYZ67971.1 hypothetical protein [Spartinivicinus marinus]